jgi:hypothetical protein
MAKLQTKRKMAKHVALVNAAIQYPERQELVALGYYLSQRKECIGDLPKKNDPTIKLLYSIASKPYLNATIFFFFLSCVSDPRFLPYFIP